MNSEDSNLDRTVGIWRDIITYDDGSITVGEWDHNCIVYGLLQLIACLMKRQSGYNGIGYWAVGSGLDTWGDNPPAANSGDIGCVAEIGRKQLLPTDISFIDENDQPTGAITNAIMIDVVFGDECNGKWREFSIFGGNATAGLNSGIAINHKTHGLISKASGMSVRRQIKFRFR